MYILRVKDMELKIKDYDTFLGKHKRTLMKRYYDMAQEAFDESALSKKVKHLMALAIALGNHCENCAKKHLYLAWIQGATEEEIADTLGVLAVIAGGSGMSETRKVDGMIEELGLRKIKIKKKKPIISVTDAVPA
jgi:AhpD family alkylhydroperoxidase